MKNGNGVVIHLSPKTKGVNLKLAGEGVKFTFENKRLVNGVGQVPTPFALIYRK